MCRNIKTLHNFKPPATDAEIRASALQFVRKLSGFTRPSKANQLAFDRARAYGMRLNIPAGTAVRFEPGDTRSVELVALGGQRIVSGLNGLVEGALDDEAVRARALERVRAFAGEER